MVEGIDLDKRDMEKRIRAFAAALSGADVGLFFMPAMVCRSTSGTSLRRSTHSSNPKPISISKPSSSTSC